MSRTQFSWVNYVPVTLVSILFISQIVIGIYLLPNITQIQVIAYVGIALYVLSGIVFGWLPVIEFRKKGSVRKGRSYIHTTTLVETGIYSIVRHPQYVTFMLWAVAGMLLFQHWIVALLGCLVFPLTYIDLIKADEQAIEKFGEGYKAYMDKVPRANFVFGFIRRFITKE